jgi:predicted dehydrogenase
MATPPSDLLHPAPVGLVGLGGYAGAMCKHLLKHPPAAGPYLDLKAVYEPNLAPHGDLLAQLHARGVQIMPSYEALLAQQVACIWLPIPIHLHRPFTEQALAAGKYVLCEKPVAGTVDDVDALIAARDRSGRGVVIGFQDIYDRRQIALKRKLLDGAIGRITSVTLAGCWPRPTSYYQRNNWAGKLRIDGTFILDSPVNNAMAHFVNLAAFLAGPTLDRSITPTRIEAELYRAYPIENYDTASLRVHSAEGPRLLVLLTHACARSVTPTITLHGSAGQCTIEIFERSTLQTPAGTTVVDLHGETRHDMSQKVAGWVLGESSDEPLATLELSRVHTLIVNGASDAIRVRTLSPEHFIRHGDPANPQLAIPGIEQAFLDCAARGQTLHESRQFAWTTPPESLDLTEYRHFRGDHV